MNQGNAHNYFPNFNPIDKILELYEKNKTLYERLLKEKDEILQQVTELLKQIMGKQ